MLAERATRRRRRIRSTYSGSLVTLSSRTGRPSPACSGRHPAGVSQGKDSYSPHVGEGIYLGGPCPAVSLPCHRRHVRAAKISTPDPPKGGSLSARPTVLSKPQAWDESSKGETVMENGDNARLPEQQPPAAGPDVQPPVSRYDRPGQRGG